MNGTFRAYLKLILCCRSHDIRKIDTAPGKESGLQPSNKLKRLSDYENTMKPVTQESTEMGHCKCHENNTKINLIQFQLGFRRGRVLENEIKMVQIRTECDDIILHIHVQSYVLNYTFGYAII